MKFRKILSLITITSLLLLSAPLNVAEASNYSFEQSSWTSDATPPPTTITHGFSANRTKYDDASADLELGTPTQLRPKIISSSVPQTTDADFNAGTHGPPVQTQTLSDSIKLSAPVCGTATVTDSRDTNNPTYNTVLINSQCWMARNENVGTRIAGSNNQANNAILEKYCYGDNDAKCNTDGGLYQWDEAMQYTTNEGAQGICPSDWHIPKDSEWYTLENYLKDSGQTCVSSREGWDCATAGTKLKVGGSSGFQGILAGARYFTGSFGNSDHAYIECSTQNGDRSWNRLLRDSASTVYRYNDYKQDGVSVRCLKNNLTFPFYSSGTFTSGRVDIGENISFGNLDWGTTQTANTNIVLKVKSYATDPGTPNFAGCNDMVTINSGNSDTSMALSNSNCVTNGHPYIFYQATFNTSNTAETPSLDDLTFNFNKYATNQTLTSLPFNSTSKRDAIAKINVKGTLGASGTAIKVQVRSASLEAGLLGAQWCGSTACNGTDYFNFTAPNADPGQTLNVSDSHPLKNGGDDQWFQYRIILDSTGAYTPTLESVTLFYEFITFVGTQTNWGSGVSTNDAVHPLSNNSPDDWRYYTSKTSNLGVVNGNGDLEVATTQGTKTQTDDGTTDTGFKKSGYSNSQTQVAGTGDPASVTLVLSPTSYTLTQTNDDSPYNDTTTPKPTYLTGSFKNRGDSPFSASGMSNTTVTGSGIGTSVGLTQAICGDNLTHTHTAGAIAPVDKTVTYGTVASALTGSNKCWITQNLGATNQAAAVDDATEASAGWYWQFNRIAGWKYDTALFRSSTPTTWDASNDNTYTGWDPAKDPCILLLGSDWRLPTYAEWFSADANGGWTNWTGSWNSVLKLHAAGYLDPTAGGLAIRGGIGRNWSSTQDGATNGWFLNFGTFSCGVGSGINSKAEGHSVRCLKDTLNSYNTPGTYTSYVDGGTNVVSQIWNTFQMTKGSTAGGAGTIAIKVKAYTSNSNPPPAFDATGAACDFSVSADGSSGSKDLTTCTNLGTGRYLWYQATLTTADTANSPLLLDATANVTDNNYYSSGTYTSGYYDTGQSNVSWGTFSWDETKPGGTNITMKVRSCANSNCSDRSSWTGCDVTNGQSIASHACVSSGHRYYQYQAYLTSPSPYTTTPSLNWVATTYNYYSTSAQNLVSSAFNSTSAGNRIDELSWNETVPANTSVKVYLKSAADPKTNLTGATEYEFTNAASGCTKSGTTVICPVDALNDALKDGSNDQWFQYKVTLQTTDGLATPTFSDIYIGYNADVSKIMVKFRNFIRSFGTIKIR